MDWLTPETWITSDQHWSHNNIRQYQDRPENHFELMYNKWNTVVKDTDTVFHLGDLVCYGQVDTHPWFLDGLRGHKYLLRGNHDKHSDAWYERAGFTVIGDKPILWVAPDDTIVCFSHAPDMPNSIHSPYFGGWDINIHGHIHGNPYYVHTPDLDYRNVCVEVTDYAPVRLRDVLEGVAGRQKRDTPGVDTKFM